MFLGPLIKERDQQTTYSASSPASLQIPSSPQLNHSNVWNGSRIGTMSADMMSATSSPSPIQPRESPYYPGFNNSSDQNTASHAHNRSFDSTNSTAASLDHVLHSSSREGQGNHLESGTNRQGASQGQSIISSGEGISRHSEVGIPFRRNASGHPF